MLSPEYYDHLCDDLIKLYADLDNAIISDIVRRIMKTGEMTETAKWQTKQLQESGMVYDEIISEIASRTNLTQDQIRTLFEKSGVESVKNDNVVYRAAGLEGIIKLSPAAMQTLNAGYLKCSGDLSNLTLTTANTAQQTYITACNNAYMQISSGAFDYNTAIRNAVKAAAKDGTEVLYPSGHRDKLDVAVRRSVLTGVGQTCRQLSFINARDMGCDLMEITAHSNARPSHAEWQGQLVSLSGRKGYLSLKDIGYGTGDGFGGWNCRHDWYPFFEGVSERNYSEERLREMNAKNIEYNGKKYTEYEISQMQRKFERNIRSLKREAIAYDTARNNAPDDTLRQQFYDDFTAVSIKLKNKERQLGDFLNQTGQLPDNARTQVLGFGRSTAQKTVWANKKSPISLTKFLSDGTITNKEKEFRKALKLGRFNTKIEPSKQQNHISGKQWKNQVKQAVGTLNDPDPKKRKTPKSILDPKLDPQSLIDKYGGTGTVEFANDGKTANEYIVFPDPIGRTFDKKTQKYIPTHTLQIKYCDGGTHVFPTMDGVI